MFNWRRRREPDFTQEIEAHLALEVDRLRGEGMSAEEAQATARREFGNVLRAQEQFRESGRWMWLDHLLRDMKFALRVLLRNPGFTTVAVLSLALGIGVNALVFSVANAVVLRPLPVSRPEQLAFLEPPHHPSISFPDYRELRDRNQVFSGLVGYRIVAVEMESQSGPSRSWGYLATGNYFDVLGVRPYLGRFFHPADDSRPGASPYAVLSYGSWKSRFGGDREIVGKTIRINRQPYTVIGVAGPEFHGTEVFYWPEIWVPMMMQAQIEPGNSWLERRETGNTWTIGRLKDGVTRSRATANLNTIAADLSRRFPSTDDGLRFKLATPGLVGDMLGALTRAFSFGMLVLAGLVLLAACTNLASLVTARGKDRQREIAIRLSIGATRGRVLRQVLTEALVLALMGGTAGYGLAFVLSGVLSAWRAPLDFPVQFDVNPDWRVFLFATAISVMAGVLFGLAPARAASRTDANAILKGDQPRWGRGKLAARDVLLVVQVALCFVLVSACLLSVHGLQRAFATNLGFQPQGVSIAGFELGLAGYTEEKGRDFRNHAVENIAALPGVESVSDSNSVPLSIDQSSCSIYPEDQPNLRTSESQSAIMYQVSPQFFHTMRIELLAGREFTWHDDAKSSRVAVVNRAFAKRVLRAESALGRRFRCGHGGELTEVVGEAEDGKYESLADSNQPAFFVPILQVYNSTTILEVRSSLPDNEITARIRESLTGLDPQLPLYSTGGLVQLLGFAFFPMKAAAIALSFFGVLAAMLAITGIYGLVSYSVASRTREIGIRIAMGANQSQVMKLVATRVAALLAAGSVLGLFLALAAGSVLRSVIYGASPHDPRVLLSVLLTIVVLGLVSSWGPALRALRIDPAVALRRE